jgi:hypothetical protein
MRFTRRAVACSNARTFQVQAARRPQARRQSKPGANDMTSKPRAGKVALVCGAGGQRRLARRMLRGDVRAPMCERGLGGDAGRIDQRAIEPTGRGTSRRWLARGTSDPSPYL